MLNNKVLGLTAFVTYFGLDALTTCAGVYRYGINAEANPTMLAALGASGIIGFIALKLLLSLSLTVPSYVLSTLPGSRAIGTSALIAITTGGILVSINNASALLMGTSIFYGIFSNASFIGPGIFVGLAMFLAGAIAYIAMNVKYRQKHIA